jgi:hypothetical protein
MSLETPGLADGGGLCVGLTDGPEYDLCKERRAREQVSPSFPRSFES